MSKLLHSTVVAQRFLYLSEDGFTTLQLQKLVYFAHAMNLLNHGYGLVNDEIVAEKYGPMFRDLKNVTRDLGSDRIKRIDEYYVHKQEPTPEQMRMILSIYDAYGNLSGFMLSAMSHQDDSPWHKVYVQNGDEYGVIPDNLIVEYFTELNNRDI